MDQFKGSGSENAHRMVFVSDLPRSTAYLDIADFYEKHIGPCQICIKRPLFKSFYYAFLMFESIEHAKKACEELRFPRIKDGMMSRALPYNLHAVRGEPGGKDVQSNSVFVKGFEKMNWSHEDLYAKFCGFGKIQSCKVSIDAQHRFLGFGYVQFSKIEEAQKAIKEMDNFDLRAEGTGVEGTLQVLEYQGKKGQIVRRSSNNLYVKNFDKAFEEKDLALLFSEFGEIQNVCIMRDADGLSKGFGFVCFEDATSAEKATKAVMESNQESQEDGAESKDVKKFANLYVREAKKKSQRQHELVMANFKYKKSIMFFSLFVKNFPPGTTEEEIKIYFSTATQNEVTKVMMIPGTQQAFVNFEKQDQCKAAKEFARNVLFKSTYPLYVEYCYPKEMRLIRNEEQLDRRAMERRRNQQNQQQIAALSSSQNLIDLLTMLLKPAFQFSQGGGQRRSHSMTNNGPRGQMSQVGGMHQQMLQGGQNQGYRGRTNYMARQDMGMAQRGSMPQTGSYPASMAPMQPPMPAASMVSGMSSSVASSTNPADSEYAQQYMREIQQVFMSQEFKESSGMKKKEIVGNCIYKHVERIVGEGMAPKITGMLIDLPEVELNYSIAQWSNFQAKVESAFHLISQNQSSAPKPAAQAAN